MSNRCCSTPVHGRCFRSSVGDRDGDAHLAPAMGGFFTLRGRRLRVQLDYYAHTRNTRPMLERLAATEPDTLACMHGSAWRGNGPRLLRALADSLESRAPP